MRFAPNMIIAGAPKCGTTALVDILSQHPDVCISRIKEPRFYSKQEGDLEGRVSGSGPKLTGTFEKGIDWYRALFECANPEQKVCIEATTDYISREDTPAILAEYAPTTKIMFMVRDPLYRVYSHYLEEDKLGYAFPGFSEMIKTQHPRLQHYVDTSDFKRQIDRFLRAGVRRPILIIAMESFRENPEKLFPQILNFLNLDGVNVAWDFRSERNKQRAVKHRRLAGIITKLQYSRAAYALPDSVRRKLHSVRNEVMNVLSREVVETPYKLEFTEALQNDLSDAIRFWKDVRENDGIIQLQ